ncbi:MAG TPA: hypothetical protein VFB66_15360, partial [Tepidisphaeraceae bacterium]|nr:hypothetical protein [Tepidisphaeraceae bacterium]
ARATGGASEFITEGERIDEKVLRTFGRMASPMVSDVSVEWDGCDVQTLAEMPPLFDGDVLTVFGRAPGRLPKQVTLSCKTPTGPSQWTVPVPPPLPDGGVIATMWARRTIQSMEEVNGLQKSRHVRREKAHKSREEETVIRLSKQFNLLSSLTTFIALEHRSEAERNSGRPALRRVPVMLAEGWGGIEQFRRAYKSLVACGSFVARRSPAGGSVSRRRQGAPPALAESADATALSSAAPVPPVPGGGHWDFVACVAGPAPSGELHSLLSLLNAEGAFEPSRLVDELLADAGRDAASWRHEIMGSLPVPPPRDADAVVRTVTVLLLLRDRFADRAELWDRAATKARWYVRKRLYLQPGEFDAWLKQLEMKLLTPADAARP